MAESSWPTVAGGRSITDIQWEEMAAGFAASGVIGGPTDTAVIYADSTGMQVKVRANKLALVSANGWTSGSTEFSKTIGANASGSTRIDLVVLRLTRSTRVVTVEVRAGTPGAGAPAAVQDAIIPGTGIWELPLAQVTVTSGAATIAAGNVATVARFIGGTNSVARPKVYNMLPPDSVAVNFTNTGGPSSDTYNATGMFPVNASRLVLDKQSPESALEVDLELTGYPSGVIRVYGGVRVMATGYTSSNHLICAQWTNFPQYIGVDYSAWLVTHNGQNAGDLSGPHGHNIGQHNHGVTLPHIHYRLGGTIQITGLAARSYTVQPFVYVSTGTFAFDGNDTLMLRVAEV